MNHQRARALLPAFADHELGAFRHFLLRRHYNHCPACLQELEALQATRTALRTSLAVHRAPPGLANRIASDLPREAPPPVRPIRHRVASFAGSALAGALAGVALTVIVTRQPDPLVREAVADHVRFLMAEHLAVSDVEAPQLMQFVHLVGG